MHAKIQPKVMFDHKRRSIEGSTTKHTRRVDLTKIHDDTKFELRNKAFRVHTRMSIKITIDPIKDGTLGAAPSKDL